LDEFRLIDRFAAHFRVPRRGVLFGPGEDCAVVRPRMGFDLCLKTDAVVEGRHFYFPGFSAEDVGHKALAVNLSDLAAAGASPRWFMVAIAAPKDTRIATFDGMARGMSRLARDAGIELVGGNFTGASELSVTIAAIGEAPAGTALTRGAARPGDVIYVSGELGAARVGLIQMKKGARSGAAITRQRRPMPRLELGRIARGFATASIDVSDGFPRDLGHILQRSRVGAEIEVDRLPVSKSVGESGVPLRVALTGGEDYELILAVPASRAKAFERACARASERVTAIGRIVRGRLARYTRAGSPFELAGGFRHFD
jgi:thiamine-monophosphate kinase